MNDVMLRARLAGFAKKHQTQKRAADALGISAQYLGDILKGYRPVPARVAEQLGYKRETRLVRVATKASEETR
jgi:hypothetical protein